MPNAAAGRKPSIDIEQIVIKAKYGVAAHSDLHLSCHRFTSEYFSCLGFITLHPWSFAAFPELRSFLSASPRGQS
jgi:hypothetical protein